MKTNLSSFDEAKLTAYALNELDAAERGAVEKFIAENPDARRWVEEVRQTAMLLEGDLRSEECPTLTSEQTREIQKLARAEKQQARMWQWFPQLRLVEALAVVAIVAVLAVVLLPSLTNHKPEHKNLALIAPQNQKGYVQPVEPVSPPVQKSNPVKIEPAVSANIPPSPASPVVLALNVASQPTEPRSDAVVTAPMTSAGVIQAESSFDAVKSAPAATDALQNSGQPTYVIPAAQGASATFTVNAGSGSSSGSITGGKAPQTQMRATQVASLSGGFGGGNGGAVGGRVNAPLGSDQMREAYKPSDNSYAYARVTKDEDSEMKSLERDPALADAPTQGRFYRLSISPADGAATYPRLIENSFLTVLNYPLSTFSIDVDTASYANIRRFLNSGQMPPPDAVRIEEMINYFHYDYPQPRGNDPFTANIEIAGCPWDSDHRLVRIGLKGREIAQDKRPPSNFVFLIDVSGSMQPPERLPLIKQALRQLVKKMTDNDRVAIVVYASEAGVKLRSTSCEQKEKILEAIGELNAGGSTAGAAGIQTAYDVAEENFIKGGVNRVLLCTDGDFNVGITDQGQLVKMIQDKAKSGVFLTTLGVGTDNYKDVLMQKLADKGNGNYAYLDTLEEAQKVLIDQMNGTLVTIAKDVKIQVEFNPAQVAAYRLIGYEKRMLRKEDFNNDRKDAGEIGAGHTVTALYEVVPAGGEVRGEVDDLKYQRPADEKPERYVSNSSKEMLTLKLRYKQPDGDKSRLLEFPVTDSGKNFNRASVDFRFATAVAEFGMLLRGSDFKGESSYRAVLEMAQSAKGADAEGYRSEFLTLVRAAQRLAGQ